MSKRLLIIVAGFLGLCVTAGVGAQTVSVPSSLPKLPLRLNAWALNMSNTAPGANAMIELRVTKWSTAAQRQALITTFLEKGQDDLLKALQKSKGIGRMRYPGATGSNAARMAPMPQATINPMAAGRAGSAMSAAQEAQRQMALGYDIRYAWHTPLEDGGDRIVLAFDRYVTFAEAVDQPRVSDYPFTFIEIHLPKGGGEGEGKMALATKLTFDKKKNVVELENYSSEPVRLQQVTVEK